MPEELSENTEVQDVPVELVEEKWWLDSRTVRGTLLTVVPTLLAVLKLFGVDVHNDEAQAVVEGIASLCGMLGVVLAISGRLRASGKISLSKTK